MKRVISAAGTGNPQSQVTPFDQVLACEEHEEARVQAVLKELKQKEQEAELAMRASEQTQEEKLRTDARDMLMKERDLIGNEMEHIGQEIEKEGEILTKEAAKLLPIIAEEQVKHMLSPDFLSSAA